MADPKAPPGGFQQGGWYEGRQYWNGTFSEKGQIHTQSDQVGAGKLVSKEVVDQSDPLKGQPTGTDWNYLHGSGSTPTSKDQVTPFLNNLQESAFNSYSAVPTKTRTAEEVREMLTPDMPKPEQFSAAQEFQKLREEKGIQGLEDQLNELTAQEDEEVAFFRKQRFDERGKPVAMGVIQGRISEEEQAAAERMDFIGRQKARINDQLKTSYSVINMMMGFMEGDYQRATEAYNAEFDRNLKIYDIVRGEERDARSDFESDRANASANLTTYMNAVTSGNLSYDSLDTSQKLMIQKLEIQSGMPQGFISNLQMAPGDKLITFNDKTGEALMTNADGSFSVVQTGMRLSPTSGDSDYSTPTAQQAQSALIATAKENGVINSYGHIHPDNYKKMKQAWIAEGLTEKDFDERFSSYIDPNRPIGDYGAEEKWE